MKFKNHRALYVQDNARLDESLESVFRHLDPILPWRQDRDGIDSDTIGLSGMMDIGSLIQNHNGASGMTLPDGSTTTR